MTGGRVLLCASEVAPFAKTGGLADVAGALAVALERLGFEVLVALPRYRQVRERGEGRLGRGIRVRFVDHGGYYDRAGLYGDGDRDYPDNLARFAFFCQAVLAWVEDEQLRPDWIHCHDWQTALIPLVLSRHTPGAARTRRARTVLTIHNLAYQGVFPERQWRAAGLAGDRAADEAVAWFGHVNLLKGGLLTADALTTVSPTYSREIQEPALGFGLDRILRQRSQDLVGILNGLDPDAWHPGRDGALADPYDQGTVANKARNKQALQAEVGLAVDADRCLVGMVSRLVEQKGVDLLAEVTPALVAEGAQVIVVGSGEARYHRLLTALAARHPGAVAVQLTYDDRLSSRVYAGADLFAMPSRFEPCGLGQLIAFRYGTIPVARRTGGLADTITDCTASPAKGTGFLFEAPQGAAFLDALRRALAGYRQPPVWDALRQRVMGLEFSWDGSAQAYAAVYARLARG